ncbi:MFS transporter [Streptomyces sp. DSM 44917]|uniref:MFS transporter n=1 Tax=Streptomyces boetiae TaxID=3075541 RepID=A0ABU2LFA7_9ACTN|nr:MFS transporter [Streptomyces sp. DSM 44917]MDT0310197.1 MFS transporter [Streptomyces sp. DSM 44917]
MVESRSTHDQWALVAVAGMLSFIAMLDMSIINVAVADIGEDFGTSDGVAQWAVLGYQVPVVALLLPAGRWLDRAPFRSVLLGSVAGFVLCGLAAAAAPHAAALIAARAAQGTCAAVLFVLMPVLAIQSVRPEVRGRAMSVPATLGPLGAVCGPMAGGVLLDQFGWRAVLLVKLPVCVAAWLIVRAAMPRAGRPAAPGGRAFADAGLVGGAVTLVLLALTLAVNAPAWLLLALPALPLLVLWARGPGGRPVRAVLATPGSAAVNGAVLALGVAFAAVHFVVALHLQRGEEVSASATGLTLLAFPLGMALAGPAGGRLADRFGPRPVAVTGACLVAAGYLPLALLGDWSLAQVAWPLAVAGVGMGLYGGPTQFLAMAAMPPTLIASAGATIQLARSLGFALGPALATAIGGQGGASDDTGARAALTVAAVIGCAAVPLLARRPGAASEAGASREGVSPAGPSEAGGGAPGVPSGVAPEGSRDPAP